MNAPVLTTGSARARFVRSDARAAQSCVKQFVTGVVYIGPGRVGCSDSEGPFGIIRFNGDAMRNGFWKILGRMPALALAVAVAPAAVADGPLQYDNPAEVGPAGPSAIPVVGYACLPADPTRGGSFPRI